MAQACELLEVLGRGRMELLERVVYRVHAARRIADDAVLKHDDVHIARMLVREESDFPCIERFVACARLRGTGFSGDVDETERVQEHRGSLKDADAHAFADDFERVRLYRKRDRKSVV